MNNLSASDYRSAFSKTRDSKLSLPTQNHPKFSKLVERSAVSISSVVAGLLLIFGQSASASFTFSAFALITSEANRRRTESLQQVKQNYEANRNIQQRVINNVENKLEHLSKNYQKQTNNINVGQQSLNNLEDELKQIKETIAQSKTPSQKYLTKKHLAPLIQKSHQLQRQHRELKIGQLTLLSQQMNEIQQQLNEVESTVASQQKQQPNAKTNTVSTLSDRKLVSNRAKISNRPVGDRVAIFIDEGNLYHSAVENRAKFDYPKLFGALKDKSTDCQAIVYTAVDPKNKKQSAFLSRLKQKGFQIVSKTIVKRADGSVKGNLDLEIGLGLINLIDSYDTAVLVSGDADFVCAVNQSRSYGKRVEVASFRSNTSSSLIKAADRYIELETIQDQIC